MSIFITYEYKCSDKFKFAVIAMIFSATSVWLTLFEYNTKRFAFQSEFLIVIKFKVKSIKKFNQRIKLRQIHFLLICFLFLFFF